jgi:hypothetical protein
MNQARPDSNANSTASRRTRRNAATIAAGTIALAIAAAAVFDERAGRMPAGSDPAGSGAVPVSAAPMEGRALAAGTPSAADAARPRYERTNEPAYTNAENPHGG